MIRNDPRRSENMVITVFGEVVVKPGTEEREEQLTAQLKPVLQAMPGYISYKTYRADDGEEIGLIRFDSRESLDAWVHEGAHGSAQRVAHEIYESFWVQTAETFREYTWKNGIRIDGDLTDLFSEA
jgi:heme-degrading monooxygenase HmoA